MFNKRAVIGRGNPSQSYEVSRAVWDHSVVCHRTQVNTLRLNPSGEINPQPILHMPLSRFLIPGLVLTHML